MFVESRNRALRLMLLEDVAEEAECVTGGSSTSLRTSNRRRRRYRPAFGYLWGESESRKVEA